jgi:hypothetical protein
VVGERTLTMTVIVAVVALAASAAKAETAIAFLTLERATSPPNSDNPACQSSGTAVCGTVCVSVPQDAHISKILPMMSNDPDNGETGGSWFSWTGENITTVKGAQQVCIGAKNWDTDMRRLLTLTVEFTR